MARRRQQQKKSERRSTARRRAEEHESGFQATSIQVPDGMSFYELKPGIHRVEIMPYTAGGGNPWADEGELHYERTYWQHANIGPNRARYICPAKTWNRRCPVCEYYAKRERDPNVDPEEQKQLLPKERQIFLVYDHDQDDKGLQLWDCSFHLFGKQLETEIKMSDAEDEVDFFYEVDNGKTLKLGVEERKFGGRTFSEVKTVGFKDRREELDPSLFDHGICLDDLLIEVDYDKLKSIFLQEEDGEEETEEPATSRRRRQRKEELKDEEDDEEEEEEEEEEEKPARRQRRAKKEEEKSTRSSRRRKAEEEEEEEEEEPEEKPPTKRGRRGKKKKENPYKEGDMLIVFEDPDDEYEGEVVAVDNDDQVTVEDDEGKEWTVDIQNVRLKEEEKLKRGRGKPKKEEPADDEEDDDDIPF